MSSNTELIRSITVYGGLPIFIFGTLGSLLNVRFLWRTRENPCAFIFLASSLINCIVLLYGLLTRILDVGFNLDWSTTNLVWCKTRIAFTQASALTSLTCVCLASIDRFLVSCRQEKYRKLSKLSFAKSSVILTILFWLAHSVPYLVYVDLIPNSITGLIACSIRPNKDYTNYRTYVALPLYFGLFPATILVTTGFLTYKSTNQLRIGRQRELIQKQLTTMMLLQIPIVLLSTLPYTIFTLYTITTSTMIKSINQRSIENLLSSIITLLFYITYSCQFFVFFVSSSSFREEAKKFFLCQKTNLLATNQIQPCSIVTFKNSKPVITRRT